MQLFLGLLIDGLIVALGKFCTSPVILPRKMQLTFILKLVLQFLVDPVSS